MTQKLQGYGKFVVNEPTGYTWTYRGCRLKNALTDTNNKKNEVKFQANNAVPAPSESTEPAVDDHEDKPSPRQNEPRNNDRDRICPLYSKNNAPMVLQAKSKWMVRPVPTPF